MAISEAIALFVSGLVSPRRTQTADGNGAEPNNATADAGFRIVVGGFEVIDVLREFLRIDVPEAGLVGLVQIRIEEDNRFESEYFVDQFRKLRAGLDMQVHLQRAPRELVEIVHLAAPRIGLPGMLRDASRQPADNECGKNESQKGDGIGSVGGKIEPGLARREVALDRHGREGNDDGLPESAQQSGGHDDEQVKQNSDRQQPLQPVSQRSQHDNRHDPQRALHREKECLLPGATHAARSESSAERNVGSRQPDTSLSVLQPRVIS